MASEPTRLQKMSHWQKMCDSNCPICWDEAHAERAERVHWFADTHMQVRVQGKPRPVLRCGARLYAGEDLSMLNPSGAPGRVWSALDIDALQYNIDFMERVDETAQ